VGIFGMDLDYGSEKSTLDDKGRIIIPVEFRGFFQGELLLTYGMEKCAWIMTPPAWERMKQGILHSENLSPRERRLLEAKHLRQTQKVELDKQGRIPIALPIRKYANLTKICMVSRDSEKLSVWDFDGWYDYLALNDKPAEDAYDKLGI
jgi:MraZ protein